GSSVHGLWSQSRELTWDDAAPAGARINPSRWPARARSASSLAGPTCGCPSPHLDAPEFANQNELVASRCFATSSSLWQGAFGATLAVVLMVGCQPSSVTSSQSIAAASLARPSISSSPSPTSTGGTAPATQTATKP